METKVRNTEKLAGIIIKILKIIGILFVAFIVMAIIVVILFMPGRMEQENAPVDTAAAVSYPINNVPEQEVKHLPNYIQATSKTHDGNIPFHPEFQCIP